MNASAKKAEEVLHDLQKRARKVIDAGEIVVKSAKVQWTLLKKQIPHFATKQDLKALNEQLISLNRRVGQLSKKLGFRAKHSSAASKHTQSHT
jgi:hypothetical protein